MIPLSKIRELDVAVPGDGRSLRYLSAASGLVCLGSSICVIADDELHLGVFPAAHDAPGRLVRLFDGELPAEPKARKKQKPDLEAVTALPPFGPYAHGALLALGSASKKRRRSGALLGLDASGGIEGASVLVDFAQLFEILDRRFPGLNIEGAVASGDEFCLLQRGNKRDRQNAVVRYSLPAMLAALCTGAPVGALAPEAIDLVDLGAIDGVPLTMTDGHGLPDGGMVFTAVAEDTEDTYNDGACLGAGIGIVERGGKLRFFERLGQAHKVEGVAAQVDGNLLRLLLVSDADDASVPACLYAATIAL